MSFGAAAFRPAILIVSTLFPQYLHAEEIDTEHIFAFTIGTDVGSLASANFRARLRVGFPNLRAAMRLSARNSNWSSYPSRISGSRLAVHWPDMTSVAFQLLRIARRSTGKVLPSIYVTDCLTGGRLHSA